MIEPKYEQGATLMPDTGSDMRHSIVQRLLDVDSGEVWYSISVDREAVRSDPEPHYNDWVVDD